MSGHCLNLALSCPLHTFTIGLQLGGKPKWRGHRLTSAVDPQQTWGDWGAFQYQRDGRRRLNPPQLRKPAAVLSYRRHGSEAEFDVLGGHDRMVENAVQRRLAAILAADVVGYSRLTGADEDRTLARLRALRSDLIDPTIAVHNGRVVKRTGDGAIVEFRSVVDAVRCAIEVQNAMIERNAGVPPERRIEFRIGIHLGDIVEESDGDLMGDGVNIAARLEGVAAPGAICLSEDAYRQVKSRLDLSVSDLGETRLKNIADAMRIYSIQVGTAAKTAPLPSVEATAIGIRHPTFRKFVTSLVVLALAVGGAAIWYGFEGGSTTPVDVASKARMKLSLPAKPSIAVLPFTNMSNEAGQENFVDGMTDDLITDLSKVSGLFVISRNSTFVYKGKAVRIAQVAEELGVRYVLEGSVQRAGDRLRVNAQLIDALTGGHVWADRFDGSTADLFSAQDAFLSKIVEALKVNLTGDERQEIASAKTGNLKAKEAFDEGWNLYLSYKAHDTIAAIELLKKATELDPEYGRAYAALALAYFRAHDSLWPKEFGFADHSVWHKGLDYLELAKKYPTPLSHTAEAIRSAYDGQAQAARLDAGLAIALDPNDPEAQIAMAWALTISGEPAEALNSVATAMRLNPNYPSHYALARGAALFTMGDLKQAAEVLGNALSKNPIANVLLVPLSSILAQLGRREEARKTLLKIRPGAEQQEIENFPDVYAFPFHWDDKHASVRERLNDGLRVAALPLDVTVLSLEATLRTGNLFEQIHAAIRLGWFGPAAAHAVPTLIEALKDKRLRNYTIATLGKIGPPAKAAIPALVALQNETLTGAYAKDALFEIRGY